MTEIAPSRETERGIVYVLSNDAFQDYIKIGSTKGDSTADVLSRMRELDNTSVPLAFTCEYAVVVDDYRIVERKLHAAFADKRARQNREFFADLNVDQIRAVLELVKPVDVTPSDEQAEHEAQIYSKGAERQKTQRRAAFAWDIVGLADGDTVVLLGARDVEVAHGTVVGSTRASVLVDGEERSLSESADSLLQNANRIGFSGAGTLSWTFTDPIHGRESLAQRRDRIENERPPQQSASLQPDEEDSEESIQ